MSEEQLQTLSEFTFSDGFDAWLRQVNASLVLSSYQVGRLVSIGQDEQGIWTSHALFRGCMGFAERGGVLAVSTSSQVILYTHLKGDLKREQFEAGCDRVYFPRMSWFTGDLKIHDVALTDQDEIVFVNTAFDCLATVDLNHSFKQLWRPPFITQGGGDRCHLNGLSLIDGQPAFVTAIGRSDEPGGWRQHKRAGGLLIDTRNNHIVLDSLSMPHSPRWHQGKLWLIDSGNGDFGYVDLATAKFEPVAFCPGFGRGLALMDDWAVIGLSNMRRYKAFEGLVLGEKLERLNMAPVCGLIVVSLTTGKIVHWVAIEQSIQELYEVAVLPGVQRPMVVSPQHDLAHRIVLSAL